MVPSVVDDSSSGAVATSWSAAADNADNVVGGAIGSTNQDHGNPVDINQARTKDNISKQQPDADQKDASEAKASSARYHTDIYGRVPGKEPKYPIPCPSEYQDIERIDYFNNFALLIQSFVVHTALYMADCKRELAVSRFCQHLEKCMGLGGRGVSSSHHSSSSGSQAKRRKSSI